MLTCVFHVLLTMSACNGTHTETVVHSTNNANAAYEKVPCSSPKANILDCNGNSSGVSFISTNVPLITTVETTDGNYYRLPTGYQFNPGDKLLVTVMHSQDGNTYCTVQRVNPYSGKPYLDKWNVCPRRTP